MGFPLTSLSLKMCKYFFFQKTNKFIKFTHSELYPKVKWMNMNGLICFF